ncbi:hypothetical protein DVR12_14090 [Chitinophaga silvatica]|uniref:Uncharacterized protein n=1 Tax=Chitinophaga silvatica TaxID=2282649 RepID=A0A3E1Y9A8_9BACT|nr:hypothetical protein [Chitinophaga silvatica]RFS21786.1 hypothetical protein DVR12_14090 [Chitinophaga silvatica]
MDKEQIYDWLISAFSRPGFSEESYYYDRRDNEFYSIHICDVAMLNDDFTLRENVQTSYPDRIMRLISDRIIREENKDQDILEIPALSVKHRKIIMSTFLTGITDKNLYDVLHQRMLNQDGTQRFDFYFGSEASDSVIDEWHYFKRSNLIPEIDKALKEMNIDIEISHVWDLDGGDVSISLRL